jgi:hypothetical protein
MGRLIQAVILLKARLHFRWHRPILIERTARNRVREEKGGDYHDE